MDHRTTRIQRASLIHPLTRTVLTSMTNVWAGKISLGLLVMLSSFFVTHAQTKITIDHNTGAAINAEWKFKSVPSPSRDDAASKPPVLIVDGQPDGNTAAPGALTNGLLPASAVQPRGNF